MRSSGHLGILCEGITNINENKSLSYSTLCSITSIKVTDVSSEDGELTTQSVSDILASYVTKHMSQEVISLLDFNRVKIEMRQDDSEKDFPSGTFLELWEDFQKEKQPKVYSDIMISLQWLNYVCFNFVLFS